MGGLVSVRAGVLAYGAGARAQQQGLRFARILRRRVGRGQGLDLDLRADHAEAIPLLTDALDTFSGKKGGVLWAVSKTDGTRIAEHKLGSSPVFDGLIAANGRLYLSMKNGAVVCLR